MCICLSTCLPLSNFSLLFFYWRDIWRIDDNMVERLSPLLTAWQNQKEVEMKTFVLTSDSCTSSLPPPFHTFTCLLSWIPAPPFLVSLLLILPMQCHQNNFYFHFFDFKKNQSSLLFKACVFNFKNKLKSTKLYCLFFCFIFPPKAFIS